uniref:Uncharacterized protein n=1 Tax=Arundo donax TaxID=35708 RepID=A0A0A8XWD6_ARUDO
MESNILSSTRYTYRKWVTIICSNCTGFSSTFTVTRRSLTMLIDILVL